MFYCSFLSLVIFVVAITITSTVDFSVILWIFKIGQAVYATGNIILYGYMNASCDKKIRQLLRYISDRTTVAPTT